MLPFCCPADPPAGHGYDRRTVQCLYAGAKDIGAGLDPDDIERQIERVQYLKKSLVKIFFRSDRLP